MSTDAIVAFALAVAAAALVKVPALFGIDLDDDAEFYGRNVSLFVLPLLTGYFAWKRRLDRRTVSWLAAAFVAAAVFANVYPFAPEGSTEVAHGATPADRALARRGDRIRGRPLEPGRRPHGLRALLG